MSSSRDPRPLRLRFTLLLVSILLLPAILQAAPDDEKKDGPRRLLYVAQPGIRDYVRFGGHGIIVYDIDDGHRFIKRIPMGGKTKEGKPVNVKGVCAHAGTARIYVSTWYHLIAIDLLTDQQLWERTYEKGCDRMSITPDGKWIFLPSLEKDIWNVVRASEGDVVETIRPDSRAHNTIVGLDGQWAYLAGLGSPHLTVASVEKQAAVRTVGPFSHSIRPFTINGSQTLCFVNVNQLLGFEVGDLVTGKPLHRVEVEGFEMGPVKRHGCPSHGIGLTPDEKELWVVDGHNEHVHIFDATVMPPKQKKSIRLREQPGWVTFTIAGDLGYPSTGEVIDVKTHEIVHRLFDEEGRMMMSEKMLEIQFEDGRPVRTGDQFGLGRVTETSKKN